MSYTFLIICFLAIGKKPNVISIGKILKKIGEKLRDNHVGDAHVIMTIHLRPLVLFLICA